LRDLVDAREAAQQGVAVGLEPTDSARDFGRDWNRSGLVATPSCKPSRQMTWTCRVSPLSRSVRSNALGIGVEPERTTRAPPVDRSRTRHESLVANFSKLARPPR
jgi:hypothetical protein